MENLQVLDILVQQYNQEKISFSRWEYLDSLHQQIIKLFIVELNNSDLKYEALDIIYTSVIRTMESKNLNHLAGFIALYDSGDERYEAMNAEIRRLLQEKELNTTL